MYIVSADFMISEKNEESLKRKPTDLVLRNELLERFSPVMNMKNATLKALKTATVDYLLATFQ